jgi:carboxylate-amine ligase
MTVRRVGIEEELLLVDAASGVPAPVAQEVIERCCRGAWPPAASVKKEFFLSQVEINSQPHHDLNALRLEVADARGLVASAAAEVGALSLAVPGPPVAPPDLSNGPAVSAGERYDAIRRQYGAVADASLMCALHVHVEVADVEEAVGVIDRVRPWVPLLVALSANSPYWHGVDTGYESWRSRLWNAWPTSGPAEVFGDAASYRRVTREMVERGSAMDDALVNFDVRVSPRYPTVEFRVADVCTDLQDAVAVAALCRAATQHAARLYRRGCPPAPWRTEALRSAAWRAARFGRTDQLVCPLTGSLVPHAEAFETLTTTLGDELEEAGDLDVVHATVDPGRLMGGAQRQRSVHERAGFAGLLADLARRSTGGTG